MSRLLWVDDDGSLLDRQIEWLTRVGFEVQVAPTVDHAWALLTDKQVKFDGVILDMMMGTGALLASAETMGGLRTGQIFLQRLTDHGLLNNKTAFIYTASDNQEIKDFCTSINVPLYSKLEYPGKAIALIAVEVFGRPRRDPT